MGSLGVVRYAMHVHCVHERPRQECYHSWQTVGCEPQYMGGDGIGCYSPLRSWLLWCGTGWIHLPSGIMLAQRFMRGSNGRNVFDDDVRSVLSSFFLFFFYRIEWRGGVGFAFLLRCFLEPEGDTGPCVVRAFFFSKTHKGAKRKKKIRRMSLCENCNLATDCRGIQDIEDAKASAAEFHYEPIFQPSDPHHDETEYYELEGDFVKTVEVLGKTILQVKPEALTALAQQAFADVHHFFRKDHLSGWRSILEDPEASDNDRFVAHTLLQNACVAAGRVLPACQDTGTAIVLGKRGELCWTGGEDEMHLSKGVWDCYMNRYLRYSQTAALDMFKEVNTGNNLPVQFDLLATAGNEYHFLFVAKGGGSANKAFLYQETKALLNPKSLREFIEQKLKTLGTAACPPYHIALVIGGTSAEMTMKTVKLASCRYYDSLPTTGNKNGRAFRDLEWEAIVMDIARKSGIGAQFGGKYFAHQARVIRLPRHGASCPVGLGVSCSADRQILAKITPKGVFVERLVRDPAQYLPELPPSSLSTNVVNVDLNQPMSEIRKLLSQYPVTTRLSLTGTLIVARDIAHAKIMERLNNNEELPQYMKDHLVYYAGPAKTPEGMASGSFGPTTAGRMDSYLEPFMAAGGSFITLAKGNRSKSVTEACKKYGGFYLGSIGGSAAILAQNNIKNVEVVEFPELGMEAVWRIDVVDFPAFIIVDDKGNDFFSKFL
ncbi:fumarate hydratase, putative [Trypanosoma cruzi marinkellei]|uniref:Fumarate hydratase, putative n=1 Tax=Trypanosoma cruzi marinkellei TaxID=85056 RepID=K2MCQ8_TRYCR|nr:fumarate hydratase, putative [Trypanosoma cruzi marinkellei]